jgi:hypothetical protein
MAYFVVRQLVIMTQAVFPLRAPGIAYSGSQSKAIQGGGDFSTQVANSTCTPSAACLGCRPPHAASRSAVERDGGLDAIEQPRLFPLG